MKLNAITFITRFLVSVVSFGSTETRVVQALKANDCNSKTNFQNKEEIRVIYIPFTILVSGFIISIRSVDIIKVGYPDEDK